DLVAASDEAYRGNTPSGALGIWQVDGRRLALRRLDAPTWSLAFSPDDRVLAVGTDSGKAILVDAATGAVRRTILPRGGAVTALALAHDGTLATGPRAGIVQPRDAATGTE